MGALSNGYELLSLLGYRKFTLAIIAMGIGVGSQILIGSVSSGLIYLILGIYFSFVLGNVAEHYAVVMKERQSYEITAKIPEPVEMPNPANQALAKILEYQESSMRALEYIVGFVRKNDPAAKA